MELSTPLPTLCISSALQPPGCTSWGWSALSIGTQASILIRDVPKYLRLMGKAGRQSLSAPPACNDFITDYCPRRAEIKCALPGAEAPAAACARRVPAPSALAHGEATVPAGGPAAPASSAHSLAWQAGAGLERVHSSRPAPTWGNLTFCAPCFLQHHLNPSSRFAWVEKAAKSLLEVSPAPG